MIFEPAAAADLPAVVALVNGAYRGDGGRFGWTHEAAHLDGPRTTLADLQADLVAAPEALLLVMRDAPGEAPLGCVWLEPVGAGGAWYLGLLTIDVDQQNRHLGRTLLAAAEAAVQARGGVRVRMTVLNIRDTLIQWYERRGYALTDETQAFPYGDTRFGVPTRDDLAFVVMEKAL